jgi:hypothetical protein
MPEQSELVAALSFGHVDSESEPDLDEKYIRTEDFERFVSGARVDLVLGPKGAGKTALFRLFDRHEQTVRRWAPDALHDIVVQPASGMRDLTNLAGGDLSRVLLREELDFERLWTAYIGWKAAAAAAKGGLRSTGALKQFQRANGLRRDWRVVPVLRRGWNAAMSDHFPAALKLTVLGTGLEVASGKARPWDMSDVLRLVDQTAARDGKRVWLLFDNLDELLPTHRSKRVEALGALFTVCNQLRASYPNVQPRIFLRTDIWDDVAFNNKSHWIGKELRLSWSSEQLLGLMLKRAASSDAIRAHLARVIPKLTSPRAVDDLSTAEMRAAFYVLFDPLVYDDSGESWTWMMERSADGHGQALPRELITFGNVAREKQQAGRYPVDGPLISGEAIREAYIDVSRIRCETYLAEFPELRSHFNRFNAKTTPRFHRAELNRLMSGLSPSGNAMIDALCDVGVIKPTDGHRESAQHFEVPLLYRPGLKLRLRGRR